MNTSEILHEVKKNLKKKKLKGHGSMMEETQPDNAVSSVVTATK